MSKAKWVVDLSHSTLEFSVKHMMFATVKGRFSKFEGVVFGNLPDLTTAEIEIIAETASIDTREPDRDAHLRSADFFDAEQFPQVTFKSKAVKAAGDDYQLVGDLTMHGVTREVTFDLTFDGQGKDPWGNEKAGITAAAQVNRKEFGLNWNAALEAGGVLVGDTVKIAAHIQLLKQG